MKNRRFNPLLPILIVLAASGFTWAGKDFKEGKRYLELGAYSQAITHLQAAFDASKPGSREQQKIEETLGTARRMESGVQFAKAEKLVAQNQLVGALEAFGKAAELDPDNPTFVARYAQERAHFDAIRRHADELHRAAFRAHEWKPALAGLEELESYVVALPEIARYIDEVRDGAAGHHDRLSDAALAQGNYREASEQSAAAWSYRQTARLDQRKRARRHLLLSSREREAREWDRAYEQLKTALSLEPGQQAFRDYESSFTEQWSGVLYNEAVQANNTGELVLARMHLNKIQRVRPGFLNVPQMLDDVNGRVASTFYARAEELFRAEDRSRLGTAMAYYMLVAENNAATYPGIRDKITEAKRRLRRELEFRLFVDIKNSSGEPNVAGQVRDQILTSLKNSRALRHVTVLERESLDDILREQGMGQAFFDGTTAVPVGKLKSVQAGIYLDVVNFTAVENGRERPSYGSSRYVSGTRLVHNPNYSRLQHELVDAQNAVLTAQTNLNAAKATENQSLSTMQAAQPGTTDATVAVIGGVGAMIGRGAAERALAKARKWLDDVRHGLRNEPPTIEEDVWDDYRYPIFNLELRGDAAVSFKVVDFTTSEMGDVQTVVEEATATDRYIPGDPGKGVDSDPNELPSREEFKAALLAQTIDALIARLEGELSGSALVHYRDATDSAAAGIEDDSLESYIRYMYSAGDLSDPTVAEANTYIRETIGLELLRRKN